ncbi:hypothetical protein [Geminocystis sp. GBBB08]|uniref:hypothetical protein n=1 Tax=Geminocystis sp. GBBB08 TaxID=2604140 RepID=UPI0027E36F3C|nr:hypothetical protein [Geminocystis sp. GBBB08]MBL1210378.1 hypothetical protein [Geminocystis sp. GBBB08]
MNTINTTLSPEQNQVENDWEFIEVWIDPMLNPPYVLLLLADCEGNFNIYDPAKNYEIIFSCDNYESAKLWLLEDEYEPIEGRFSLDVVLV